MHHHRGAYIKTNPLCCERKKEGKTCSLVWRSTFHTSYNRCKKKKRKKKKKKRKEKKKKKKKRKRTRGRCWWWRRRGEEEEGEGRRRRRRRKKEEYGNPHKPFIFSVCF